MARPANNCWVMAPPDNCSTPWCKISIGLRSRWGEAYLFCTIGFSSCQEVTTRQLLNHMAILHHAAQQCSAVVRSWHICHDPTTAKPYGRFARSGSAVVGSWLPPPLNPMVILHHTVQQSSGRGIGAAVVRPWHIMPRPDNC